MGKKCINCEKNFSPDKNHPHQKFCSEFCREINYLPKSREIQRKRYQEDIIFREKKLTNHRKWYTKNIEKIREKDRLEWKNKTPEQKRDFVEKNLARRRKRREFLILKYGGKCVRCGQKDIRVLEFNHKIPRRVSGEHKGKWSFDIGQKDIREHPEKFEILCKNCNRIHDLEYDYKKSTKISR